MIFSGVYCYIHNFMRKRQKSRQFERATQKIKKRGISITTWCNEIM